MKKLKKGVLLQVFLSASIMIGSVGVAYASIALAYAAGYRPADGNLDLLVLQIGTLIATIMIGGVLSTKVYRSFNMECAIRQALKYRCVFRDALMPDISWRNVPATVATCGVSLLMSTTFGSGAVFWTVGIICAVLLCASIATMVGLGWTTLRWRAERQPMAEQTIIMECRPMIISSVRVWQPRMLPVAQAPEYYDF